MYTSVTRYDTIAVGLLKKEDDFYFMWCVRKLALYSDAIHLFDWKSAIQHDGGV